jgi:hypothetical protein
MHAVSLNWKTRTIPSQMANPQMVQEPQCMTKKSQRTPNPHTAAPPSPRACH